MVSREMEEASGDEIVTRQKDEAVTVGESLRKSSPPRLSGIEGFEPRGRLDKTWERLKVSFWSLLALGTGGGIALSFATHWVDRNVRASWREAPLIFAGGADDAHYVLSIIAGSVMTVIVTSFSLTVVVLQLASNQYSPRLLRSFEADRGMQVALGAYIATFVYTLMILKMMYTPEGEDVTIFIPTVSVSVAIFLTLVCVALLTYFLQHVSKLIQSSTIVKMAEEDTMRVIARLDDLKRAPTGPRGPEDDPTLESLLAEDPLVLRSKQTGYLEFLDAASILDAVPADGGVVVLEIPFGPGHFVSAGLPVVKIWSSPNVCLGPEEENEVLGAFELGQERSFRQDLAFGLRQLSDIALKGLSPGVNDPTTAMQALDRLEVIFVALGSKALPPRERELWINGTKVLVRIGHPSFEDHVGLAFDQIRRAGFASGDVAVLERLLEVMERAITANTVPERQRALWARAFAIARVAPRRIPDPCDAVNLMCRVVRVSTQLLETERWATADHDLEELVGFSERLEGRERIEDAVLAARRSYAR